MSTALRDRLRELALTFAAEVAAALFAAPVEELAEVAREAREGRATKPASASGAKRAGERAAPRPPPPSVPPTSGPKALDFPLAARQRAKAIDDLVALLRQGQPLPAASLSRLLGIGKNAGGRKLRLPRP